jgi:alanyl-tRNA synthetase
MTNPYGIKFRSGNQIRSDFIEFFKAKDHDFVPSSPVVLPDDPTLLFANSGMNQFKSIFLGDNKQGLKRAVNSQKCLRVSGKHNDLDEVGRDGTHHTLFEMLGNWSFGDYYKEEAIAWHWELLTEVWGLPKDRLFVSVFEDDDEAAEIWQRVTDIEEWRIMRFGAKENFWEMGEVGPCGPCSELHFDFGDLATQKSTYSDKIAGVNGENARFIEICNLVFMQYERQQNGDLKPLKEKHVDTGMGFERIVSVIQGVDSNYATDVFTPIIEKIASLTGVAYDPGEAGTPHRVIADHLRALSFCIADGVTPGNEGRGYVLRRVLRRASRFSQQLNQDKPFIYKLVGTLSEIVGEAFPEIAARKDYIEQAIQAEEERFMRTLKDGMQRFDKIVAETQKRKKNSDTVSGTDVFLLKDTYGFPEDLTAILAEERQLKTDLDGFKVCMEEQRERARGAQKFDATVASEEGWTILNQGDTDFIGYDTLEVTANVLRYREVGDDVLICLDKTPFYAEAGGQVGDIGTLKNDQLELRVEDTIKILEMHVHRCSLVSGLFKDENLTNLSAQVDREAREATVRNHSATHLLHAALRQVLGDHVQQQGSRVGPEGIRFDFTHQQGMSAEEMRAVETLVNEEIMANRPVKFEEKDIESAKNEGAMALFGEKYGERVRTIRMGQFSFELCGGTHAQATGDIGMLLITAEGSIAAGIRRLEAVTGSGALAQARKKFDQVQALGQALKVKPDVVLDKVAEIAERNKALEKELKAVRQEQVNVYAAQMISSGTDVAGVNCIIQKLDAQKFPKATHQVLLDSLAGKLGMGVAFLTHVEGENLSLLAAVGEGARSKVKAGDLVKELSKHAEGRGGGRPDKAQAGSKHPEKEPVVLDEAKKFLETNL